MRTVALLALLAAGSGCTRQGDFVGDDLGDNNNPKGGQTLSSDVPALEATSTCTATSTGAEALTLTGGVGEIDVLHTGYVASACAVWEITYEVDRASGTVDVTYEDVATQTCASTCPWELAYAIADLDPGTWTVYAGAEEGDVTVE